MSQGERVHDLFYQISIPTIYLIDELVKDKYPWQALRRHPSHEELTVAFWAVYEAEGPLPERKSFILATIAHYLGQKSHKIVEEAGRDWPVIDEVALTTTHRRGEDRPMAKTATKPAATAVATKTAPVKGTAADAQAAAAKDEAATPKERSGKAPGGKTWVEWFKAGHAAGKDPTAMRDEYVTIRTPEYEGRIDVLKRHAYRHLRLALPDVKLPKETAAAE
jgi:hypothetical protein